MSKTSGHLFLKPIPLGVKQVAEWELTLCGVTTWWQAVLHTLEIQGCRNRRSPSSIKQKVPACFIANLKFQNTSKGYLIHRQLNNHLQLMFQSILLEILSASSIMYVSMHICFL